VVFHKTLLIVVVEKNSTTDRLLAMTARMLKKTRKGLWKHKNVRVQLDEDDEVACWVVICRQPYQYRLPDNVRDRVKEF
jgi:hypothetical protein